MQKLGRVALWVVRRACVDVSGRWRRQVRQADVAADVRALGYPDHFYLIVGAVEVAAGLALLVPQLASPASLVLIVIMIGAGATRHAW